MTDVSIIINSREVEKSLDKLMLLLGPAGLIAFLGSTMAPYLARRAGDRFAGEGDDVTGAWAPLKDSTIRLRAEQGFPAGPINRRTGELENWVTGGSFEAYPTVDGASMRYPRDKPTGELRKKMETAQKGKKHPSTVARPVLGVNERDLLFFQTALSLAVEGAIR